MEESDKWKRLNTICKHTFTRGFEVMVCYSEGREVASVLFVKEIFFLKSWGHTESTLSHKSSSKSDVYIILSTKDSTNCSITRLSLIFEKMIQSEARV